MSKTFLSQPQFNDEAAAYEWVEARLWPNGPTCPHCGNVDAARIGKLQGKSTRVGLRKCYACRKPFTVKVGTIFEDSHIAMRDWLVAIHLICSSKKGISANQLHRTLGITLKSAWFMSHRIRLAMDPGKSSGPIGGEGKTVESDETFLNKSPKTKRTKLIPNQRSGVQVLSLVERGGPIRSMYLDNTSVRAALAEHLHKDSRLVTDGAQHYKKLPPEGQHESVDHSKFEFVRGDVHTNTLEGFFSIFKRGLVGVYQHMDKRHLDRYLAEFDFRMNTRAKLGCSDSDRAEALVKSTKGKRLTYRTTHREVTAEKNLNG
ncbi:MAG: IS1595 family transposase [Rhodospirillaceae bacterium]|nr:MAG: IS1595 family transposase [Rhodospirillaceae bacterium]